VARWRLVVASTVAAAAAAGIWWWGRPPPEPEVSAATEEAPAEEPPVDEAPKEQTADVLVVHVSGPVARPGIVVLPADSRVADAVAAAGGALGSADLQLLNLAAPVADGEQVIVPRSGGPGPPPTARPAADEGQVNINEADVTELEELPGVGPVLAERIVAHREANGSFGSIEDLLDVPGIGEGRLATLRDAAVVP
jgi:competence protein ComEA